MNAETDVLPRLPPHVVLREVDGEGRHVIKDARRNSFLRVGGEEAFLFKRMDGRTTVADAIDGFEAAFGERLSAGDVRQCVALAEKEGLFGGEESGERPPLWRRMREAAARQSPLFFRVSMFDPDRVLDWLEPRTRWLFSRPLAAAAAAGFLAALLTTWANAGELVGRFATDFGWRAAALALLTTMAVTVAHEFGHGLACKRYGGQVREMGALWIFFTPCLFCNVSDAWLFGSRWRRLVVSLAGTYVDLLIWVAAVFAWRVSEPTTAVNYMAWIVVSTCGLRVAFNLNPLMRLDGYYALSDAVGVPNLRRRARKRLMEYARWILWGAERPKPVPDGRTLLWYGVASWVFAVGLLNVLFLQVTDVLSSALGLAGFLTGAGVFAALAKKYFRGSLGEEFGGMFKERRRRAALYVGAALLLLLVPVRDRVGGPFRARPAVRWEVRAPVDGFLREVRFDYGERAAEGQVLARLEVPELESLLSQKEAEVAEVEALLTRLEAGPRPEEVTQTEEAVLRAARWRDLAEADLARAERSLAEELAALDRRAEAAASEKDLAEATLQRAERLHEKGGISGQELAEARVAADVARSQLLAAEAARRGRAAEGTMTHAAELARRQKEYEDAKGRLTLLRAGSRPEDVAAQRARLDRLLEERRHLRERRQKQVIRAPAAGNVATPRLRERIGQYLTKGAPLCVVEDPARLEAEIAIPEENARRLRPGQEVSLKPRSLPFERIAATVDRVAPTAGVLPSSEAAPPDDPAAAAQQTVTVYCQFDNDANALRSGMTGYGRVYHGYRPIGWILLTRAVQFFRTEFWL